MTDPTATASASGADRVEAALFRLAAMDQTADALDIGEAALLVGQIELPQLDLAPYRQHLAELALALARACCDTTDLSQRVRMLHLILAETLCYAGDQDDYDAPDNAILPRVIDRRRGLPVALGILFIHAARASGCAATGLSFPGHFLIRLDGDGERAVLDPFAGGRVVGAEDMRGLLKVALGAEAELLPEHHRNVGDRDVLIRLLNNLRARRVTGQDWDGALRALSGMVALRPTTVMFRLEQATLNARIGRLGDALAAAEAGRAVAVEGAERRRAEGLVAKLRRALN